MKERFPFGSFFLAGLAAGILAMNFGKSILLEHTGLLDLCTLHDMRDMAVDSSALFVSVLCRRMGSLIGLAVMSTTYLGLVFCAGAAFWYGLSAGAFLAAGVLRLGIKGILFALAATMPQYLAYLPAFYVLLLWCGEVYRSIYGKNVYTADQKTPALPGRVLKLLLIAALVILGCMLESFANPAILFGFLQIL